MMTRMTRCCQLLTSIIGIWLSLSTLDEVKADAIRSPRLTTWGVWGTWDDCKDGTFVSGMRLKVENIQGHLDDTALNGVQFFCTALHSRETEQNISSSVGPWGDWEPSVKCPGNEKAIGFQLRSEPPRSYGHDDTAANNLRLLCEGGVVLDGGGLSWGNWTSRMLCPRFQYLCGVKTQIEEYQGSGSADDDTALNNLDMDCCTKYPWTR